MKIKDLEIGEYYTDGEVFFRMNEIKRGSHRGPGVRAGNYKGFMSNNSWALNESTLRVANYSEKEWIKQCINQGTYVIATKPTISLLSVMDNYQMY